MSEPVSDNTIEEMKAYYRARAREYDEWFFRQGRYDHGPEMNALWFRELYDVQLALQGFRIEGNILELAPGTGIWTEYFLQTATSITAVDASPEMITINQARVADQRVSYLQADLFTWQPTGSYDAACFCFWISHIPIERFVSFLHTIVKALRPGGKIFFVDGRRESGGTAIDQVLPEGQEQVMVRSLNNGQQFHIVKNFYDPAFLVQQFADVGLTVTVKETPTYFLYGYGTRSNTSL